MQKTLIEDSEAVSVLMEALPLNLKEKMSRAMYAEIYENIDFLKGKEMSFISWICPLLNLRTVTPGETLQYEGGKVNYVYFVQKGQCAYVLRQY